MSVSDDGPGVPSRDVEQLFFGDLPRLHALVLLRRRLQGLFGRSFQLEVHSEIGEAPRSLCASIDRIVAASAGNRRRGFRFTDVATMQANNVQRIYSFNAGDFEVFAELIVAVPGRLTP